MDRQEMDSRIQDAKDAIADLEAALSNADQSDGDMQDDYQEARDWAQQLEGAALDIIDTLNDWIN